MNLIRTATGPLTAGSTAALQRTPSAGGGAQPAAEPPRAAPSVGTAASAPAGAPAPATTPPLAGRTAPKRRIGMSPVPPPPPPEVRNSWWRDALGGAVGKVIGLFYDVNVVNQVASDGPIHGAITLFVPHTGLDDPPTVMSALWRSLHLIPLVTEGMRFAPGMKPMMDLAHAIPVPDTTNPAGTEDEIDLLVDQVAAALRAGHNVAWWPAGEIMRSGDEKIGGDALLSRVLEKAPEARILVAQQKGLYGTPFSYPGNGDRFPDFSTAIGGYARDVLHNLSHLRRPVKARRPVTLTLTDCTAPLKALKTPVERNDFLDRIALAPDPQTGTSNPPRRYPIAYDDPRGIEVLSDIPSPKVHTGLRLTPEQRAPIAAAVRAHLADVAGVAEDKLGADGTRLAELGLDSLAIGEHVVNWLNEKYGRSFEPAAAFQTIGDVIEGATGELSELTGLELTPPSAAWTAQRAAGQPGQPRGPAEVPAKAATALEAFAQKARAEPSRVVAWDELLGEKTNAELAALVLLLGDHLRDLPGRRIGALVPSSVTGTAVSLACQAAGKTLVPLDPSWSDAEAKQAMDTAGVEKIILPQKVIRELKARKLRDDREAIKAGKKTPAEVDADIAVTPFGSIETRFVALDEITRNLGQVETLAANALTRRTLGLLERHAKGRAGSEAIMLFGRSAGGRMQPVTCSHGQVLDEARSMTRTLKLNTGDVVLGLAPSANRVGYVAGLLPAVTGVPGVLADDPRGSAVSAALANLRGASVLVAPPAAAAGLAGKTGDGAPRFDRTVLALPAEPTAASPAGAESGVVKGKSVA